MQNKGKKHANCTYPSWWWSGTELLRQPAEVELLKHLRSGAQVLSTSSCSLGWPSACSSMQQHANGMFSTGAHQPSAGAAQATRYTPRNARSLSHRCIRCWCAKRPSVCCWYFIVAQARSGCTANTAVPHDQDRCRRCGMAITASY
jgi:hypothetical protein